MCCNSDVFSEFCAHCSLILHSILCNGFYVFHYCTQYCNSERMMCSIKRLLILSQIQSRQCSVELPYR